MPVLAGTMTSVTCLLGLDAAFTIHGCACLGLSSQKDDVSVCKQRCTYLCPLSAPQTMCACPAGTVAISDVSMGWGTPLDIRGFTWTEPEQLGGQQLASIHQIKSPATLLDMARGRHLPLQSTSLT